MDGREKTNHSAFQMKADTNMETELNIKLLDYIILVQSLCA